MTETKNKLKVIGVGGFARSGKDTFVKIASKILEQNGYSTKKLAFADALKNDMDGFLKDKYGISAWTDNTEEKKLIRPFLVAHGCGKREQTAGKYWVDKIDQHLRLYEDVQKLTDYKQDYVFFISDCRFPNEVTWLHDNWNGWFVHLKKYRMTLPNESYSTTDDHGDIIYTNKVYDSAPNEEEAKQDPICEKAADYRLELENAMERSKREGIKITVDELVDYSYLNDEIKICLTNCPFLTIQK